jgi:ABC-type sugar transport system ATPase subunit
MVLGIFGAPPPQQGSINVQGKLINIRKPRDAMRLGIGLVPEDRKQLGLVLGMGVGSNLSLSALGLGQISQGGFVQRGVEERMIDGYVNRFQIRTPSVQQLVGLLSGGNQQKVVLAKWLAAKPRVLIVDEPTRGVDVGTKAEIYSLMRELARDGLTILMISSDLPEILTISDRILVMRAGSLVGEIPFEEASEERIMALAALEHMDTTIPVTPPSGYAEAVAH